MEMLVKKPMERRRYRPTQAGRFRYRYADYSAIFALRASSSAWR
jgi:hypothetical protein